MMRHARQTQPSTPAIAPEETRQSEERLGLSLPQALPGAPLPAQRKAAILKTRAQALARIPDRQGPEGAGLSVIEFLVGEKSYAIESTYVREVQPLKELTPLPGTPPSVMGIMNVRGRILAVVDIRRLLGLTAEEVLPQDGVIILHRHTRELGILTNGMLGVRSIPLNQLHPIPPTLSSAKAEYLRGMTGSQTIVLHALQLLADPQDPDRSQALRLTDHPNPVGHTPQAASGRGPSSCPASAVRSS